MKRLWDLIILSYRNGGLERRKEDRNKEKKEDEKEDGIGEEERSNSNFRKVVIGNSMCKETGT